MPCVDAIKGIACLLIVAHHLAAYGPMSDFARPLIPGLLDWLYEYGRMAVQAFLVIAGFLSARNFAPSGALLVSEPTQAIKQRYDWLVMPYLAALILAIGCTELARSWMQHDSISSEPDLLQLLAHVFLLQDLLGQEALSAGVWYVAIDFQLFVLMAALIWLSRQIECRYANLRATIPILVASLTTVSLFAFNRNDFWDVTALYFFGSYGLGALSYWASARPQGVFWLACLSLLVTMALLVDFRWRIAIAGIMMLMLGFARQYDILESWSAPQPLIYLGRISYSIFLVHFPLCLVINAMFFRFLSHQPATNAYGLILALCVSICGGAIFFRWIESRPHTNRMRLLILTGFMSSSLFAIFGSGV